MKMKKTIVMIVVWAVCFVYGEEGNEGLIDTEELYIRQKLEFVNALGYESYSVVDVGEDEEQGEPDTGPR
ncbi:hypothetical protein DPMN_076669 [Dreissena polymorpha]|uniref:Uncharacterized protein n=1 Tax=Dreissena polymorpha TaxID=45954 RepID=A0A9D3YJ67_DREPO|nr:hypothetical protein DPMN_076506 [Dreissena polymorpha]KAH3701677.1 hypothetical protein DPMN_076669 [Dreissena polymorpha]